MPKLMSGVVIAGVAIFAAVAAQAEGAAHIVAELQGPRLQDC